MDAKHITSHPGPWLVEIYPEPGLEGAIHHNFSALAMSSSELGVITFV